MCGIIPCTLLRDYVFTKLLAWLYLLSSLSCRPIASVLLTGHKHIIIIAVYVINVWYYI